MKKSMPLIFLGLFLSLMLFISACQQPQPVPPQKSCSDECSDSSCSLYNYIACTTSLEGCKVKSDEGIVKGKCDVECLSAFDCQFGNECNSNFKCQKKAEPKPKTTLSLCGNGNIDAAENCGNCIDVKCSSAPALKTTCINDICIPYDKRHFEYNSEIRKYCGYTQVDSNAENIASKVISSKGSCSLQINDEVTSDSSQLLDGGITYVEQQWNCGTQSAKPIDMPQSAIFQLDKEYVINKFILVQNSASNDDARNVRDYSIEVSSDSTNGNNGYWTTVYEGQLKNKYQTKDQKQFPPISASWVKITIKNLHNPNSNIFTLAEFQLFEARNFCVGDREED